MPYSDGSETMLLENASQCSVSWAKVFRHWYHVSEEVFSEFLRKKIAGATIPVASTTTSIIRHLSLHMYHHHHHHYYYLTVQLAPAAVEFACKNKEVKWAIIRALMSTGEMHIFCYWVFKQSIMMSRCYVDTKSLGTTGLEYNHPSTIKHKTTRKHKSWNQ